MSERTFSTSLKYTMQLRFEPRLQTIIFSSEVNRTHSLAVVVNAQCRHGRHFEIAKRCDPRTDSVAADRQRHVFAVFFPFINPFFRLLHLARLTLWHHDLCETRTQVAKLLQTNLALVRSAITSLLRLCDDPAATP